MNSSNAYLLRLIAACLMALVFDTFQRRWGAFGGAGALFLCATWAYLMTVSELRHA